jgi:transposase
MVRFDCTTVSTYAAVNDEGLIRFGRSKDDPKNPQIKISIAILDSLGLPICISVVPGNCADDPLYLPAIRKVRQSLQESGLLFVGDCKMAAIGTRTEIAGTGDYYLMPLPEIMCPSTEILEKIISNESRGIPRIQVNREYPNGEEKTIAHGFEESVTLTHSFNGEDIRWNERRIYIQSLNYAHSQNTALDNKLEQALCKIANLNRRGKGVRYPKTLNDAQIRVDSILQKYEVNDLIQVVYDVDEVFIQKQKHGNNPKRTIKEISITCSAVIDSTSYDNRCKNHGWRVYATNMPLEELSLEQVVLAYRDQYRIEDMFHRLKGKPLSLHPMLLNRDDHIDGLVKLLSIALRCIVCIEKRVHDSLKEEGKAFEGIYEYNPKKTTKTPRAERILNIFNNITLTIINPGFNQMVLITELSELQVKTLNRLKFDINLYDQIGVIL